MKIFVSRLLNYHFFRVLKFTIKSLRKKDYFDKIQGNTLNSFLVEINDIKKINKDIYYIIKLSAHGGFFAQFNDVLQYLYFAYRHSLKPIIFYEDSYYYDESYSKINNIDNVFAYYFSNPTVKRKSQLSKNKYNKFVVSKEFHKNASDVFHENIDTLLAQMFREYIKINTLIYSNILNEYNNLDANRSQKLLAVHFRGTDFRKELFGHPNFTNTNAYFEKIDVWLKDYSIDKIFLATDDKIALKEFKYKYKDKLVYFENSFRSDSDTNPFFTLDNRKYHNFLNGYEVLRDTVCMSFANYFISSQSNVSRAVKIIKQSRNENFVKVHTFKSEKSTKKNYLSKDHKFKQFINDRKNRNR